MNVPIFDRIFNCSIERNDRISRSRSDQKKLYAVYAAYSFFLAKRDLVLLKRRTVRVSVGP
ncbi:hypothetical protein CDO73_16225 [Saccharibacillus sp. O23]|nr:hypothetical protein CDO73_16225 [Saccharibacillus sp. O23]